MGLIDSLFLLLLLFDGAHSFVYSCQEVKNKLINTTLHVSTKYACLVLDEDYGEKPSSGDIHELDKLYVQFGQVKTSFMKLANATCIEQSNDEEWSVVADNTLDLYCSYEFSLLFTSSLPTIKRAPEYAIPQPTLATVFDDKSPEQVIVSPKPCIKLRIRACFGFGNVTVFTGVGTGEEEHRFFIKSWRCADLSEWIISFETVITIIVDADVRVLMDYSASDNKLDYYYYVTPEIRVTVMSSGRSHNLQYAYYTDNILDLQTHSDLVATATCSPCYFDPIYNSYVKIWTYDDDWTNSSLVKIFRNEGVASFNMREAIQIRYDVGAIGAANTWDCQDNFVIEMTFAEIQHTTPSSIVVDADSYCGCALDKKFGMPDGWDPSKIWLDIVIILDTSESMGQQGLIDAITLIKSFFGAEDDDVLTTNTNAEFYTRVGLISMSDKPEVLFNLNMTKNDSLNGKVKQGLNQIDVDAAFEAALQMLTDATPQRPNTRQVIYYLTNSDPPTISQPMDQFKSEKGKIIVNNFVENGIERPGLKNLASDGYYFSDIQYNYMASIQLFCKANCYCLPEKTSYRGHNPDPAVSASGGCFRLVPVGTQYSNAKKNCATDYGLIASIHDQDKANFVNELMNPSTHRSDYYWIGYAKTDAGEWQWEDQSADPYTNWDENEPSAASVAKCTYVDSTTSVLKWGGGNCNVGFPFACESGPCSVGSKNCIIN